ncbi:chromosome segregation protein SMC [Cobetia sp. 3AK]|uniref:chromosome segregation protein SMC n=1 Tax=Cobetia sp. 3AK TaxID=3040020 RepID=UPI00244A87B9|nr:chromosome segregation protein SMC [Cobetia sp. 3AK]MDH2373331.1 chromosome segregation protein SMC [Cobetia sp. 3AK]
MRLKSIKLVGFKSFVDPVTVPFDSNMTAILGPNGCGKSNVIDAVRWVMGESSAKNLRGESMTDVIFNGSTGRKPVGQASIELTFDNADGSLGGAWSEYAEIAVKRLVTRDGQSGYFLNGQKCRRRDISDVFLGTGLGPRSYSIIGQGMISQLIEARPDDLRSTLEEAAGISKYKERRRETENRMKRTQENMERLDDLREELDKQLERLKRQAEAAKRYQTLKQDEYRLKGELAVLRRRGLRAQQREQQSRVAELETGVEREILGQRQCESQLEEQRYQHDELAGELETHQAAFYETGAQIARLEQSLEHARTREQQLAADLEIARRELSDIQRVEGEDGERLEMIEARLEDIAPELELARETLEGLELSLEEAEERRQDSQSEWERFSQADNESQRGAERAQSEIQRIENAIRDAETQRERRRQQLAELPDVAELRESREELREQLDELTLGSESLESRREQASESREQAQTDRLALDGERDQLRQRRNVLQGEQASLQALIDAALRDDDDSLATHLDRHGLAQAPALAEGLEVAEGWESVSAWVLGPFLKARMSRAESDATAALMSELPGGELLLVDAAGETNATAPEGTLAARISGAPALTDWLSSIHCVESQAAAWGRRDSLAAHESVLTPDGLWLGRGWSRRQIAGERADSVIGQRARLEQVVLELEALESRLDDIEARLAAADEQIAGAEQQLEHLRVEERELGERQRELSLKEAGLASRLEHVDGRARELEEELEQLAETRENHALTLEEARERWQQALESVENNAQSRESLERSRREHQEALAGLRAQLAPAREQVSRLDMERQRLVTERDGMQGQRMRAVEQREKLAERIELLEASREEASLPQEEEREQLEMLLETRLYQETKLNACRDKTHELVEQMRQAEQSRQTHERNLEGIRQRLEEGRMQVQALTLKADAQDEQLLELGYDEAAITLLEDELDPNATESAWSHNLEQVGERIKRLGAINLAAIEEYDQQAERRNYLEAQHAELAEALETLERAIRKIDQETRVRFKDTFDKVNAGIQTLFPKIFGGGTAWLTLTGDDLLETGVAIMARPPGKKNSTIHLLSGGEKALTALALVFAIFQLNPAPFCMLDEVDAPLDDANVGRYARLVKEMSESVQFIYITHNKIAMEAADRLMGVTMQEPGVSRLVSVGIEEAAVLAEA